MFWSYHLLIMFCAFGNAEIKFFRQLLEKWLAVENIHRLQKAYSVYKPVYQASLLSVTGSLFCNLNAYAIECGIHT